MIKELEHGWASIDLGVYGMHLSFMTTRLPLNWLDQAIMGLEKNLPITIHGSVEPGYDMCTFTGTLCHAFYIDEGDFPCIPRRIYTFPYSKLQFCKELYEDILKELDEWVLWLCSSYSYPDKELPYDNPKFKEEKAKLSRKLKRLKKLIDCEDLKIQGDTL